MATGYFLDKWKRVYINGYDMSGYARKLQPLEIAYDEADLTAWTDTVHGFLRNQAQVNIGALNTVFDNTATVGVHAVLSPLAGSYATVLMAQGILAAPAAGDPCFGAQFNVKDYTAQPDGAALNANVNFDGAYAESASLIFPLAWGTLLHASGAETAAYTGNSGIDNPTAGATTSGGYFIYQVLAGNGTATLSIDDSANNSTWLALSGATSGSIDCSSVKAGMVAIGNTATVRRYLRWQLALGTATTVTFVAAFMRNYP